MSSLLENENFLFVGNPGNSISRGEKKGVRAF